MIQTVKAARGAALLDTDLNFNLCTGLILIYASRGPARWPEGAGKSRPAGLALPPPRAPLRGDEAWRREGPGPALRAAGPRGRGGESRSPSLPEGSVWKSRRLSGGPDGTGRLPGCARPPRLPRRGARGPAVRGRRGRGAEGPSPGPARPSAAPGRRGRKNRVAPPRPPLPFPAEAAPRLGQEPGAGRAVPGLRGSLREGWRRGAGVAGRCFRPERGEDGGCAGGCPPSRGLPGCGGPPGPARPGSAGCGPGPPGASAGAPERCPGTPESVSPAAPPAWHRAPFALLVIGVL